ncbi:hypothetical protein vBAbaMPhT2_081 [Acinetobacter phage vB_AbaM_PhT2]|uniref:Uncharacterized protein n=1 Tax=Acinetobacter phage vB_AbaM_PhT2 TaxID=2690230 RepID=A0A6B9T0I3_9CAUD|nr:hypothetical protein HYQ24_gp081 [Acinetobacter phage vB_AbaM_PhT2]QHJ75693.1 hypothetical protein vBAbaMPhT2_081 [Acinetobacter phage vB_AbaM_PhT2]QQM13735.1 hypothetical protein CPT_Maestro_001 [Acinetobacter phage Maestro]CAH1068749.1 Uncharacterised protein [Acinetobacter phage MD-2021a]CAH1069030.1 Uncharacterised protein [Acinetobacter phage MD-2021a]
MMPVSFIVVSAVVAITLILAIVILYVWWLYEFK